MGLFGKSDNLAALLKKVESESGADPAELDLVLDLLSRHEEFHLERNAWMFSHAQKKVRDFAAKQLLERKEPALVDVLIKELPTKPSPTRLELARLVLAAGPERVQARLGHMIHSSEAAEREAALDLIDSHPRWQDLLGYLKVTIKDHEPRVRHRAARVLAKGLSNQTIFLILRELIHDEDATLRHIIIEAFARQPNADTVEPFFERLPLEGPEPRAMMVRALSHLARHAQSQIEERLLPILGDENPTIREIAVKLLGEMPDRTKILRAFLIHCRGIACWLRDRSIQSLQKISDVLLEPLLELMEDPDDDIRVAAMVMASGSKDPRLVPLIKAIFLGKSDWWIRSMAAEALGKQATPDILETLSSQLDDPELRYSIISILGAQGTPAALSVLRRCLKDPQRGVRIAVLSSLQDSKALEAQAIFTESARNDPDEDVREKALELLQGIGDKSRDVVQEIQARNARTEASRNVVPLELEMANESLNG
jgi:HEAT repeat protein